MTVFAKRQVATTRFVPRDGLLDRIAPAEIDIERVLQRHGLKFAINVVTVAGRPVHQEIVLVDRKD